MVGEDHLADHKAEQRLPAMGGRKPASHIEIPGNGCLELVRSYPLVADNEAGWSESSPQPRNMTTSRQQTYRAQYGLNCRFRWPSLCHVQTRRLVLRVAAGNSITLHTGAVDTCDALVLHRRERGTSDG